MSAEVPGRRRGVSHDQINGLDDLLNSSVGQEAVSDWQTITQNDTNQFAEVTGDKNPLHVDPHLAGQTPYGTTIVHGLHLLAMAPMLFTTVWQIQGFSSAVNYGSNRLRFPAALPVGTRVRMRLRIASVEQIPGGARLIVDLTFEPEHGGKPVCVSESVFQLFS